MEYENIRIDTTDISKIAQNTGMPEWKISRIKDHVFSNEHILDAGVKRFDADPEIADAWYRLTNGTYNQNDIDLLNHEYFESKFESFYMRRGHRDWRGWPSAPAWPCLSPLPPREQRWWWRRYPDNAVPDHAA